MKKRKKQKAPLSHSNLTEHENLRSHYDPNGSWTGTPDGWDKTPRNESGYNSAYEQKTETSKELYDAPYCENYVPADVSAPLGNAERLPDGPVEAARDFSHSDNGREKYGNDFSYPSYIKDAEAGKDAHEYPLEGEIAPSDGDSYEQNTRDMSYIPYPDHTSGNGMADVEAGKDNSYNANSADCKTCRAYDHRSNGGENNYPNGVNSDIEAGKDDETELHPLDGDRWDGNKKPIYGGDHSDALEYGAANHNHYDVEADSDYDYIGETDGEYSNVESDKRYTGYKNDKNSTDVEADGDIYPVGEIGEPTSSDGYPSVPDGELTMDQAAIKEDITPVQDVDDL